MNSPKSQWIGGLILGSLVGLMSIWLVQWSENRPPKSDWYEKYLEQQVKILEKKVQTLEHKEDSSREMDKIPH